MRKVGILASGQTVSSSSSEANMSDASNGDAKEDEAENVVDPLVNQDHFASPFQRQSARDGAKMVTCFSLFMFLCINPLSFLATGTSSAAESKCKSPFMNLHIKVLEQFISWHFFLCEKLRLQQPAEVYLLSL